MKVDFVLIYSFVSCLPIQVPTFAERHVDIPLIAGAILSQMAGDATEHCRSWKKRQCPNCALSMAGVRTGKCSTAPS